MDIFSQLGSLEPLFLLILAALTLSSFDLRLSVAVDLIGLLQEGIVTIYVVSKNSTFRNKNSIFTI